MCGRFTLTLPIEILSDYFGVNNADNTLKVKPRYNIAPNQSVLVVKTNEMNKKHKGKTFAWLRWGFIQSWLKGIGSHSINVRAETVANKPFFKEAFKKRRCLIVADGFYAWKHLRQSKLSYYIHKVSHSPLAIAGVWGEWQDEDNKFVESCTLITTDANSTVKPIHARMPVILLKPQFDLWLDPDETNPLKLAQLLKPYQATDLETYPVNSYVDNPMNDNASCITKILL